MSASQSGIGSTRWLKLNQHISPFNATVQIGLLGTSATYQVEGTLDETDVTVAGAGYLPPVPIVLANATALTADGLVPITTPVSAVRVTITAGAGTVLARVLQAGVT